MGSSVLHIKTELECKVYLFDGEKGIATPGKYFNLEVRKGEQDLLFISTSNNLIQSRIKYQVAEGDSDYRLNIDETMFMPIEQLLVSDGESYITTKKATKEELANGVEDEYGVVYSRDGSQLLKAKKNKLGHYVIKRECRVIRDYAFYYCETLKSVVIPDGLTHIGDRAFEGCSGLRNLSIPSNMKHIGYGAFRNCGNLWDVDILSNLQFIGEAAFAGTKISNFWITPYLDYDEKPNYTVDLGFLVDIRRKKLIAAFDLQPLYYEEQPLYYDENDDTIHGISEVYDDEIIIPDGITHIGDEAINNSLKYYSKYVLPDSLTHIGSRVFSECLNLSEIVFPSNLKYIGERAFYYCQKLTKVSFPNGLNYIGDGAFLLCQKLSDIKVRPTLTTTGIDYCWYYGNEITNQLPKELIHIGDDAFYGCDMLSNIALNKSLKYIGEGAFSPTGIKDVSFHLDFSPESQFKYIDGCLIDTNKKNLIAFFPNKNESVMQEVTVPEGVIHIGHNAFRSLGNISKITLPQSLLHIGRGAFNYCSNLLYINIPTSVNHIDEYAFEGCKKLSELALPSTIEYIGKRAIDPSISSIVVPAGSKEYIASLLSEEFHDKVTEITTEITR